MTKLDHVGRPVTHYACALLYRDAIVTMLRCTWTRETVDVGPFVIESGDALIEYYYPGAWYNVFRIEAADSTLKGWYCNITAPADIQLDVIRWRDLALDLLALPDGQSVLADEDEFEAIQPSAEVRARAQEALADLQNRLAAHAPPFTRTPILPQR
ncbi:MAG: DUF402 domain-containing protein [Anaerolineae bacterium]